MPPKILTKKMNGTTCCHLLSIPIKGQVLAWHTVSAAGS